MAEFLSQDEIDELLDECLDKTDFPFYIYAQSAKQFEIIEITQSYIYQNFNMDINNYDVYKHKITNALNDKGYEVLSSDKSKVQLVNKLVSRLDQFKEMATEMRFIKTYLDEHPEYAL